MIEKEHSEIKQFSNNGDKEFNHFLEEVNEWLNHTVSTISYTFDVDYENLSNSIKSIMEKNIKSCEVDVLRVVHTTKRFHRNGCDVVRLFHNGTTSVSKTPSARHAKRKIKRLNEIIYIDIKFQPIKPIEYINISFVESINGDIIKEEIDDWILDDIIGEAK